VKSKWKRYFTAALVLSVFAMMLAGCGSKKSNSEEAGTSKDNTENAADTEQAEEPKVEGSVKLWVDTNYVNDYKEVVSGFTKEYPDVKVKVSAGSSPDALKDVSKDPGAAADVFMVPHDQIGQMAEAGLLYPIDKDAEEIRANNVEASVQGVTWNDEIYGYPYGIESQVLFYNKAKLSEDDVKSWNTLTEKGRIGSNFAEGGANYIFGPLFMSNGLKLYGDNGEDPNGTDFNNEKGIQVLKWIAAQKDNPNVLQANESALSDLESGKIDAFLSGPWSKNDVKKALGDNMGVAVYPTVDFGDGEVPMKAFLGVKVYGVNQQTKSPLAAMALANYISNEDSQLTIFEKQGIVPCNNKAQEDGKVVADDVAKAITEMSRIDVVMPKIPEIVSFWPPMDAVINDTYKGIIKEADYQRKLDSLVADTAKKSEE